jgi:DNA replication protein DnaC
MNGSLDDLDDRLRSRLGHLGVVQRVEIRALDYRGGVDHERGDLSSLEQYSDKTFQSWDHRMGVLEPDEVRNLMTVYEAARAFADEPAGWLVLTGPSGSGKTHLAAAIANTRVARGDRALFVVVPDLLDHLRATFGPSSRVPYDYRFEEVRGAPLLVLDDLGTESATPWAREKLFQILNQRYVTGAPTVITSSSSLSEIPQRLRTRMLDRSRCRVVGLVAPPYHSGRPTR